jgi:hypothetical protein
MKRNYAQSKLKMYRIDKRHPKRASIQVTEDLGNKTRITELTTPFFEKKQIEIPKKESGEWETIFDRNGLKITKSASTDRIFMYMRNGKIAEYIGELEEIDLIALAFKILEVIHGFRKEVFYSSGRRYHRLVLSLRVFKKILRQNLPQIRA